MFKNLIKDTTPVIEIPNRGTQSIKELRTSYGMENKIINTWPNWVKLDNIWYYYKERVDEYYILNELIGTYLADYFSINTVNYKIAKNNDNYGLLSKNFRECKTKYYTSYDWDLFNNNNSTNILYTLRSFCLDEQNYHNLLNDIFKMMAIDSYMGQMDRNANNFFFSVKDGNTRLAPLFDYERSFNFNFEDSWQYLNYILTLKYPSSDLYGLFNDFPEFYSCFSSILNIDMENILNSIENDYDLKIDDGYKVHYLLSDLHKKKLVKKCI